MPGLIFTAVLVAFCADASAQPGPPVGLRTDPPPPASPVPDHSPAVGRRGKPRNRQSADPPDIPRSPGAPQVADKPKSADAAKDGAIRPEWTECEYVHPLDGKTYKGSIRQRTCCSSRYEKQNYTFHGIGGLAHKAWLAADEHDDGSILTLRFGTMDLGFPVGRLQVVRKLNEKGRIGRREVSIGDVEYFDLDGDAVLDAWFDNRYRLRKSYQLRNNRIERVGDSLVPFYDDYPGPQPPARVPADRARLNPLALGPEWIKITTVSESSAGPPIPPSGQKVTRYIRPGAIVSYRRDNDKTTRHTLLLDQGGGVDVYERDDKSAITIELIGKKLNDVQIRLVRRVNEKGRPIRHELSFGPVTYFDLNGDGAIDCWIDRRNGNPKSVILVEDHVVSVEVSKRAFHQTAGASPTVWSDGHKEQYQFKDDRWSRVRRLD